MFTVYCTRETISDVVTTELHNADCYCLAKEFLMKKAADIIFDGNGDSRYTVDIAGDIKGNGYRVRLTREGSVGSVVYSIVEQ